MIYENCLKEITLVLILLLTIFNIFILQEIFSLHVTIAKIVNEYDQEIPQSQTADNPVAR